MAKKKETAERKSVKPEKLIPCWCYKKGIAGYDVNGAPVAEMDVEQYGYVTRIIDGTQPADTDPLELKFYKAKRTYNTRQVKADVDTVPG